MRRVEVFELIRHDYYDFGLSIRAIARKRGVGRPTVRQAIASPVPPARKVPERTSPKMTTEVRSFIDGILVADRKAPHKQRHTSRRIWQRLDEELDVQFAESTIRKYVVLKSGSLEGMGRTFSVRLNFRAASSSLPCRRTSRCLLPQPSGSLYQRNIPEASWVPMRALGFGLWPDEPSVR